jgi:hypothetical protein
MSIKRGVVLEYFTRSDIDRAKSRKTRAMVLEDYEEDGDDVIVNVVCSSCGAATTRRLTPDRYTEILLITDGEKEES